MASKKARVPAADDTANRNPIVDSWKKSHDNAIHSFVQLITTATGRSLLFCGRLDRLPAGICATCAPLSGAHGPMGASHLLLETLPQLIVEENTRKSLYRSVPPSHVPARLPAKEELR
jgi:hypothetical protein